MKRFIVELGWGADLHGQDYTKAAVKAVKDAISRSCLCGLVEIFNMENLNDMQVEVVLASPAPESIDPNKVKEVIPFGTIEVKTVKGGMSVEGLCVKELGDGCQDIVVVNAALTVYIDV
ncbi:MAG: hypothetical protein PWQ82_1658 [Thermosediminibacterales bacterium]|nr:hypothetical protein [Thermosediminibacterales bacterium]MDK2836153.1 hypothetical protein [Thermosediminibacterales bacterium]